MEKVRGIDIRDFPSVRLYLDDLAKVVELFSGVCDSVAVKAGDFTFTDAQELMLLAEQFPGGVFKDLYIHGKAPYFSLAFYPFGIVLHLNEDTNEMRGVASRLPLLRERRKPDCLRLPWRRCRSPALFLGGRVSFSDPPVHSPREQLLHLHFDVPAQP